MKINAVSRLKAKLAVQPEQAKQLQIVKDAIASVMGKMSLPMPLIVGGRIWGNRNFSVFAYMDNKDQYVVGIEGVKIESKQEWEGKTGKDVLHAFTKALQHIQSKDSEVEETLVKLRQLHV
jgi:hypothetical protein